MISDIRLVPPQLTWPLRQRVLRPDLSLAAVRYDEDGDAQGFHLAAYQGDEVVAIASGFPQSEPGQVSQGSWRLRGMATAPEARGTGIGGRVLSACLAEMKRRGGLCVWCHARVPASGFYVRYGFTIDGDSYDIPAIGPHYRMRRSL